MKRSEAQASGLPSGFAIPKISESTRSSLARSLIARYTDQLHRCRCALAPIAAVSMSTALMPSLASRAKRPFSAEKCFEVR